MIVRPAALLSLFLLASASLAQQDLLSCIDPDVKEGLLFQGFERDRVISRSLPESMSGLSMSEELEFVGSSVSSRQTTVAYKTTLEPEDAMGSALGALEETGWATLPNSGSQRGGFITDVQPLYTMLCRDNAMLTVVSRPSNDATFVNLSMAVNTGNFSCDAMQPVGALMRLPNFLNVSQYMPRLTLPEGARTMPPTNGIAISSGVSGGNREAKTSIAVETQLTAQDLVDHFGRELQDQGWSHDSGWSGRVSTGSSWTTRPTDDLNLVGLLDVVSLGGTGYQASFRTTSIDEK